MLNALRKRLQQDEDGFTLIELMVVVLIIAILIAIAIPTFLGAQDRARDRGAQSDLRNGLTAAKTIATDNAGLFGVSTAGVVTPFDHTDLQEAEPSLTFLAASSTDAIGVNTAADGSSITLETVSESGSVFGISATSDGVVSYCKSTADTAAAGDCLDPAAGTWASKW